MAEDVRRALYIGRFQVFHLGHVDVLRHIDAAPDIDGVVLAVGSAQYDHTKKHPKASWAVNPFAFEERKEMIERSLAGVLKKPWSVERLPDLHDWDKWYQHIVDHLPGFAVLYSADAKERAYFEGKGKETRGFPVRFTFHAGSIREDLARGDPRYRAQVPAGTLAVLDRIDAGRRVREAYEKDEAERALAEAEAET